MANTNIGISNFISSQAPFFVRNDHPTFVKFLEAYYQFLEQEGETIERAKGFRSALDVDRSIDLYTEKLYSQFLSLLPEETIADKNLIIKHIKDFYRARGTEKSIQFLLSILYDEDTSFYYPKRDILRASDGKWYQEKSLKVFDVQTQSRSNAQLYQTASVFAVKNFTGRQIVGATSNATATVESVDVYYENGVVVNELKISNQIRDFDAGETILASYEEEGFTLGIKANVFSGILVRADIKNRGNNYIAGQTANVESNSGSGAIVVISEVSRAAIKSISAVDGGAGFQNSNIILISGGGGFGGNANVALVNTDETVHPNTYNIGISLIAEAANTVIGNTTGNVYETFAYSNLDVVLVTVPANTSNLVANTVSGTLVNRLYFDQPIANSNVYFKTGDSLNVYNVMTDTNYVLYITSNTISTSNVTFTPQIEGNLSFERVTVLTAPFSAYSNLTISCGIGASVSLINLSSIKADSNVFFETGDNLYCFGTNVTITRSNSVTSQLTVSPGLPGPLTNEPFQVIKKPNINTTLANSMLFFTYANTGPIQRILVLAGGNNYTSNVTLSAEANSRIRTLGILGKMRVVHPGSGYQEGDEIEIINIPYAPTGAGHGARGYVASVNGTGAIETVKFKELPGHYVGGSGYSMSALPTANIISATGTGGNVVVTAVLGDGEQLVSLTDDIGAILKIDILSGGSGYKTPPIINLKSFGSGTAQVDATIVQGVFTYPGRYLNDDGHLSGFNFLQDGRYYHNYSYVVKIKQAISKYRKALKDLVHPVGMSLFGEYTSVDEGDTLNVQVRTTGNTDKIIYYNAEYVANLGNIRITRTDHGLENGNTVYLEFQSGNTINIANGIFTVATSNADTFFVVQPNTVNTSGNVYYGILQ